MAFLNGYGRNPEEVDRELKVEGHGRAAAQSIKDMLAANRALVEDYLSGKILAADTPLPIAGQAAGRAAAGRAATYNGQQTKFKALLDAAVSQAVRGRSEDAAVAEEAAASARAEAKVLACLGPPGTGKTTVCHDKIEDLLADRGRVLFALPTAQLASRMRERYGRRSGLEIDTCHAAFGLNEHLAGHLPVLAVYDLIVVSQLSAEHGDRILHLWDAADRLPALVFCGDKWQMAGYGDRRPWETNLWKRAVFKIEFHKSYRCQDPNFEALLRKLRTAKPDAATLKLLQKRKAWTPPGRPTLAGVQRLLHAHPGTTIVSCTRRGAQEVNECALRRPALAPDLPGDLEANPANYDVEGKLLPDDVLQPLGVPIYKGMDIYITKNIRKDVDFVNGMLAVVLSFNPATRGLRVKTRTGHLIEVWRWSDPDHSGISYYPIRPGYCSTILKLQGAELDHISVYLDVPKVPGAAYTAISRVRTGKDFLIGGSVADARFTPAL